MVPRVPPALRHCLSLPVLGLTTASTAKPLSPALAIFTPSWTARIPMMVIPRLMSVATVSIAVGCQARLIIRELVGLLTTISIAGIEKKEGDRGGNDREP